MLAWSHYFNHHFLYMVTCISRFIERWSSSARARRSAGVEAGGARANTSKYRLLHRNGHCRYPRKTSETTMLKDVGMVVPKIKEK